MIESFIKWSVFYFIILITLLFEISKYPSYPLQIDVLDIGQGDSILLRTENNQKVLIDTGPGNKVVMELERVLPVFDRYIDLIIITHPDSDHRQGLIEVLKYYNIGAILLAKEYNRDPVDDYYNSLYKNQNIYYLEDIQRKLNINAHTYIEFLHPVYKDDLRDNINNQSIVFLLTHRGVKALFPGDINSSIEIKLIKRYTNIIKDIEILKLAHHGSKTSTNESFLQHINPDHIIISSGRDNNFGHPNQDILWRLFINNYKNIYRTDILNSFRIIINKAQEIEIKQI